MDPKHFTCVTSFNTHNYSECYAQTADGETEA